MALWFDIKVNQFTVGRVELVRIDPINGQPADNELCTYLLRYWKNKLIVDTMIHHPYIPDNPIPLLSSALEKINETQL
jgi:hypothetical protein